MAVFADEHERRLFVVRTFLHVLAFHVCVATFEVARTIDVREHTCPANSGKQL